MTATDQLRQDIFRVRHDCIRLLHQAVRRDVELPQTHVMFTSTVLYIVDLCIKIVRVFSRLGGCCFLHGIR